MHEVLPSYCSGRVISVGQVEMSRRLRILRVPLSKVASRDPLTIAPSQGGVVSHDRFIYIHIYAVLVRDQVRI